MMLDILPLPKFTAFQAKGQSNMDGEALDFDTLIAETSGEEVRASSLLSKEAMAQNTAEVVTENLTQHAPEMKPEHLFSEQHFSGAADKVKPGEIPPAARMSFAHIIADSPDPVSQDTQFENLNIAHSIPVDADIQGHIPVIISDEKIKSGSAPLNTDAETTAPALLPTEQPSQKIAAAQNIPSALPAPSGFVEMPTSLSIPVLSEIKISGEAAGAAPIQPSSVQTAQSSPRLDVLQGDKWIHELSREIMHLKNGNDRMSFQLTPVHLGKLTVEIASDAGNQIVRFETENEAARVLIAQSHGRLEQELRRTGLATPSLETVFEKSQSEQNAADQNGTDQDQGFRQQTVSSRQILHQAFLGDRNPEEPSEQNSADRFA